MSMSQTSSCEGCDLQICPCSACKCCWVHVCASKCKCQERCKFDVHSFLSTCRNESGEWGLPCSLTSNSYYKQYFITLRHNSAIVT
jgi:hypothetical protein